MVTWLEHVKKVHASGDTPFKASLKRASASWKKGKGSSSKKVVRRKKKGKAAPEEAAEAAPEPEVSVPAPKKKKRKRKKAPPKVFRNIDSRTLD